MGTALWADPSKTHHQQVEEPQALALQAGRYPIWRRSPKGDWRIQANKKPCYLPIPSTSWLSTWLSPEPPRNLKTWQPLPTEAPNAPISVLMHFQSVHLWTLQICSSKVLWKTQHVLRQTSHWPSFRTLDSLSTKQKTICHREIKTKAKSYIWRRPTMWLVNETLTKSLVTKAEARTRAHQAGGRATTEGPMCWDFLFQIESVQMMKTSTKTWKHKLMGVAPALVLKAPISLWLWWWWYKTNDHIQKQIFDTNRPTTWQPRFNTQHNILLSRLCLICTRWHEPKQTADGEYQPALRAELGCHPPVGDGDDSRWQTWLSQ